MVRKNQVYEHVSSVQFWSPIQMPESCIIGTGFNTLLQILFPPARSRLIPEPHFDPWLTEYKLVDGKILILSFSLSLLFVVSFSLSSPPLPSLCSSNKKYQGQCCGKAGKLLPLMRTNWTLLEFKTYYKSTATKTM